MPAIQRDVVAPPYDLIGAARQNQLYDRSPYNIVRLELGREADRYGAAEKTLAEWMAARSPASGRRVPPFISTRRPSTSRGALLHRTGFIARVRLEEFDRGRILPHEKTFPAAKEDRLRLLTALQINTSSIFGLYSGAHPELDRLREQVAAREPLIDLVDDLGIRNELRPIEAPDEIAIVQRELESSANLDRRRTPSLRNRAELSPRAHVTRSASERARSHTTTR